MMEYSLVFRRPMSSAATPRTSMSMSMSTRGWVAVRPALASARRSRGSKARTGGAAPLAQVFIVPICSALEMDGAAYDHFLAQSGAIAAALRLLASTPVEGLDEADLARKEIQALVMAAEVQHIVDQMSA